MQTRKDCKESTPVCVLTDLLHKIPVPLGIQRREDFLPQVLAAACVAALALTFLAHLTPFKTRHTSQSSEHSEGL